MKKRIRLLQIAGIALVVLSFCLLVFSQLYGAWAQKQAQAVATQIGDLLPRRTEGITGEYTDPQMPVLQYAGRDYIALLEIPGFGVRLPVQSTWAAGSLTRNPCRYWGSCYDGTLILGGSREQFEFCSRLDIGDRIVLTDMQGTEFTYSVQRIDRSKETSFDNLYEESCSLSLFVQEVFGSGYIIVRCN